MKKNKFVFILLAVIAGAAFAYLEFFQKSPDMIAYKSFYEDAGENKIASAEFSKDKIVFTYNGGSTKFQTENPDSSTLKEYLLLHDVKISVAKDGTLIKIDEINNFKLLLVLVLFPPFCESDLITK